MLRLSTFAMLAAPSVEALMALSQVSMQLPIQRTRKLLAQNSWITSLDANGQPYYYNEQTGQSQWEPPEQGYGAGYNAGGGGGGGGGGGQHVWRVHPTAGVYSQYIVRSCEEQVLGRFDMIEQSVYVSRQQCLVRVAADGTATLVSIGRPPTLFRAYGAAPWYVRRQSEHVLSDGEQISLDVSYPESAVFTITSDAQYRAQYSEDGGWMWNGMEWIPASLPRRIAVV